MEVESSVTEVSKLFKDVMVLLRHNMAKMFEDCGMTGPQGMVIGTISKFGKTKISDLSSTLGLSNSTISGIIDRLEKQEMVVRERSEDDKRVVYVRLTPKFEQIHQDFHKKAEQNISNIMKRGTSEEITKIIEGFTTLKKLLKDKQE